jgi:putative ABC transport system permease protein
MLPTLGLEPKIGRTIGPEEDQPGKDHVVLLSDSFWRRGFGADPEVVGQTTLLDNVPYEILGVLPAKLEQSWGPFNIWCPLPFEQDAHPRGYRSFMTLGRLKPGVSITEAQAEMDNIAARLAREYPSTDGGYTVRLEPILDVTLGDGARPALSILTAAVGFVLLISCANVANLLLARATDREREHVVRAALGAGRWRLMRQTLMESMILALAAGGLGILLSIWSLDILTAGLSSTMGRTEEIVIDHSALLFALLLSLVTAVLFGMAPALKSAKNDLTDALKGGSMSISAGRSVRGWRDVLVVAQIAMALVLVTCAGLMLRSLLALHAVDPGFDPQRLLTLQVKLPDRKYDSDEKRIIFYQQAIEQIRAAPGVTSVAAASIIPLTGDSSDSRVNIDGYQPADPNHPIFVGHAIATPGYFETMKIPLLRGRAFSEHDNEDGQRVIIVGEKMAEQIWPNQSAVGKRLKFGPRDSESPWYTVVGVVGNIKQVQLDRKLRLETYTPYAQWPVSEMAFVTRTAGEPEGTTAAVQEAIWKVDPDLVVYRVLSMEQIHSANTSARADMASLLAVFSVIGLVMSAAGLYSVIAYNVSQRTHEIGIRTALGAGSLDIVRLILARITLLTFCGILCGTILALLVTRVLEVLLFGVSPFDPITIVGVTVMLVAVAFLASYLPTRQVFKMDPMNALRCH